MPYETRRTVLSLEPLPSERFTREHWHQVGYLAPGFRLPSSDRQFDFVYCGHTVEDLVDPAALLREMRRVGRAGCISSPSRVSEQTGGVRDRVSSRPGHLHHHWIIDPLDHRLRLCDKTASLRPAAACLPLRHFERNAAGAPTGIVTPSCSSGATATTSNLCPATPPSRTPSPSPGRSAFAFSTACSVRSRVGCAP